jgi:hypothetical protein
MGLTSVVEGAIWSLNRPVWFSGVRMRARTTVVRLRDGSLLLHTPAPITDALADELRALGPVRWLVVPNRWHHLGTPDAAIRFPEAKVVAPTSALARNGELKLHLDIRAAEFAERVPELETLPLDGVPFWDETVLYHRPTRTLIGADIVMCADTEDHFTLRWGARLTGCYERVRVPPDARKKIDDKSRAARSLGAMLERPAARLVVGHAAVLGDDWRDRMREAWRLEGVDA